MIARAQNASSSRRVRLIVSPVTTVSPPTGGVPLGTVAQAGRLVGVPRAGRPALPS